jgi:putative redox protein
MIQAINPAGNFRTVFSNANSTGEADLPAAKGGNGAGFGPHELIEAGLATCLVMTARIYANEHGWTLGDASCNVRIERNVAGDVEFIYSIHLPGLTAAQLQEIDVLLQRCPVARTLTKKATLRAA